MMHRNCQPEGGMSIVLEQSLQQCVSKALTAGSSGR